MATATKDIQIVVNGQVRKAPEGRTVIEMLVSLGTDPARVAVELNRSIIRRDDWEKTIVGDGAAMEIVQFVGGG